MDQFPNNDGSEGSEGQASQSGSCTKSFIKVTIRTGAGEPKVVTIEDGSTIANLTGLEVTADGAVIIHNGRVAAEGVDTPLQDGDEVQAVKATGKHA